MLRSQRMQQLRYADVGFQLRLEGIHDMPGAEDQPTGYGSDHC